MSLAILNVVMAILLAIEVVVLLAAISLASFVAFKIARDEGWIR